MKSNYQIEFIFSLRFLFWVFIAIELFLLGFEGKHKSKNSLHFENSLSFIVFKNKDGGFLVDRINGEREAFSQNELKEGMKKVISSHLKRCYDEEEASFGETFIFDFNAGLLRFGNLQEYFLPIKNHSFFDLDSKIDSIRNPLKMFTKNDEKSIFVQLLDFLLLPESEEDDKIDDILAEVSEALGTKKTLQFAGTKKTLITFDGSKHSVYNFKIQIPGNSFSDHKKAYFGIIVENKITITIQERTTCLVLPIEYQMELYSYRKRSNIDHKKYFRQLRRYLEIFIHSFEFQVMKECLKIPLKVELKFSDIIDGIRGVGVDSFKNQQTFIIIENNGVVSVDE